MKLRHVVEFEFDNITLKGPARTEFHIGLNNALREAVSRTGLIRPDLPLFRARTTRLLRKGEK